MIEAPPECGVLALLKYVTTGASYVYFILLVPTTALTVTTTSTFWPAPGRLMHCTDVSEDHRAVPHVDEPSSPVTVGSVWPKFVPNTEMVCPAVRGPLNRCKKDSTGESNEKLPAMVPTIAPTVTAAGISSPEAESTTHLMVVTEYHDVH